MEKWCPSDTFKSACSKDCGLYLETRNRCSLALLAEFLPEMVSGIVDALGMVSENQSRLQKGLSIAWPDSCFFEISQTIRKLLGGDAS